MGVTLQRMKAGEEQADGVGKAIVRKNGKSCSGCGSDPVTGSDSLL